MAVARGHAESYGVLAEGMLVDTGVVRPPPPSPTAAARLAASPGRQRLQGGTSNSPPKASIHIYKRPAVNVPSADRGVHVESVQFGVRMVRPPPPILVTAASKAASPGRYRLQGDPRSTLPEAQLHVIQVRKNAMKTGEAPIEGAQVRVSVVRPPPPALATAADEAASPGWYRLQGDTSVTVPQTQAPN